MILGPSPDFGFHFFVTLLFTKTPHFFLMSILQSRTCLFLPGEGMFFRLRLLLPPTIFLDRTPLRLFQERLFSPSVSDLSILYEVFTDARHGRGLSFLCSIIFSPVSSAEKITPSMSFSSFSGSRRSSRRKIILVPPSTDSVEGYGTLVTFRSFSRALA